MKLYKKTLTASCVCFIILCPLSIIFQVVSSTNEWFAFASNFAVGISCSIFVVIITTFLQYKIEQAKLINIVLNKIHLLLLHFNKYHYQYIEEPDEAEFVNKISSICLEIAKASARLKFYSKKESAKISKILVASMKIVNIIEKNPEDSIKETYSNVFSSNELETIANNAIKLKYRDGCQNDIKEELETINRMITKQN